MFKLRIIKGAPDWGAKMIDDMLKKYNTQYWEQKHYSEHIVSEHTLKTKDNIQIISVQYNCARKETYCWYIDNTKTVEQSGA